MEFHLPEILTFLIHTVFTRAEGLGVRDLVCRRTCKEHTGESDVSVLSALLRVTQTSFPFSPLHVYCLQNQQNKHKGNKQKFPMQINLSTNSFCSWPLRFHESWGGIIDTRYAWKGEDTGIPDWQVLYPNAGQGIAPQKAYLTVLTRSQVSSTEDVKYSVKQKGNRTIPELKKFIKTQSMHQEWQI